MIKNVTGSITLLAILILILSSCSSNRGFKSDYMNNRSRDLHTSAHKKNRIKKRTKTRTYTNVNTPRLVTKRMEVVKTAKRFIGKPYVYGGKKPSTGFDCSGFTSHVFNENGVPVSGSSKAQAKIGKRKSMKELKQGDLIFFGKNNRVSHVGIVADVSSNSLKVIHSTSSRGVVVDEISSSKYWQERYLFGRDILN